MNLSDKIAVVTGGASGIGQATAELLAEGGAAVCIGDIARDKGETVAAGIRKKGQKAECFSLDLTDRDSIASFVSAVLQRFGRVDILVNGAGWGKTVPFLESDDAFWEKVINLNFVGPMRLTKALLPQMFERKSGKIVNISSDAGRVGSLGETVYSGAKAGLIGFTKAHATASPSTASARGRPIRRSWPRFPRRSETPSSRRFRCAASAGLRRWRRPSRSSSDPTPTTSPARS
jgi:2-hydroxycyclohexanecarboxyl-CoA dehydrogenase